MGGVSSVASKFSYHEPDNTFHPSDDAEKINLFHYFRTLDVETVLKFSDWISKFGDDSDMQDLLWSGNKVLNSCSQLLREKFEESIISLDTHHKTGPVYFKLMMDLILSSTPVSMRAIVRKLEYLTLKESKGESVVTAVSLVRGAVSMMDNNKSIPTDIQEIVFRIMKTSSSEEFNTYVTNRMRTRDKGVISRTDSTTNAE